MFPSASSSPSDDLFQQIKDNLLALDPVAFCEKYLTLDGQPFRLTGNGYKPFCDIYRYIGVKALEKNSLPIVLVKGRQVGATTMAAALELYFMTCGLFGTGGRPPMRIMHCFPQLELAYAYTKTKLNTMIASAVPVVVDPNQKRKSGKVKNFVESKFDTSSPSNDSISYKAFESGTIEVQSIGQNGDRIRGRQLCLETELPTPTGFIKLKDLQEGDQLFDENGQVCRVTKLHPVNLTPEAYRITFDDGTTVDACAEHLWVTSTKRERRFNKSSIKNTKEIFGTVKKYGENNHSIKNCKSVEYGEKELLIDPYLLGLWLGDGNRYGGIETADPEVLRQFAHRIVKSTINHKSNFSVNPSKSSSYRVIGLTTKLTELRLVKNPGKANKHLGFYNKHIPKIYLHSSYEQRLSLLQGLMDSDGCCYKYDGRCEFTQVKSREKLFFQVKELVESLGIKTHVNFGESWRYDVRYQDKYSLMFMTDKNVFKLQRKLNNLKCKLSTRSTSRFIKSVEAIPSKPMRCITVDSPSHQYLITRAFIPTHNTVDAMFFDECFPYKQYLETENGKQQIGSLVNAFLQHKPVPRVKTYNEITQEFEYKRIVNAWNRGPRQLIKFTCANREIKCTPEHKFLTLDGWKQVKDFKIGELIKSTDGLNTVTKIVETDQVEVVYDLEVEDNHNFIVTSDNNFSDLIAHNCQDMRGPAIQNSLKILSKSQYGRPGDGLQVFFGTPKQKGSEYWEIWNNSSQQYYHLGCEQCKEHFALYTPTNPEWEKVWILDFLPDTHPSHGFMVKCTKCGCEQDKREAAERGKWIAHNTDSDIKFIGYHISQLLMPEFSRAKLMSEKPGEGPLSTERSYANECLGEFYQGSGVLISPDQIYDACGDEKRKFTARILPGERQGVFLGIDWGDLADLESVGQQEGVKKRGRSYSCLCVLTSDGTDTLSVEFVTRLKRNDFESKKEIIDEVFRSYAVDLAVGDIGHGETICEILHREHGMSFLTSRAAGTIKNHIKFIPDIFPPEIRFEKDHYISELITLLKKGKIRIPTGDYEKISWFVNHCSSMELEPRIINGELISKYVKGSSQNDGMMSLLNAYLAYRYMISNSFSIHHPDLMRKSPSKKGVVPAIAAWMPGMNPLNKR